MRKIGLILAIFYGLLYACTPAHKEQKGMGYVATDAVDQPTETREDSLAQIEISMEERMIDHNLDLRHYFDSLCRYTEAELWIHRQDDPDTVRVWEAIDELSAFVRNERKTYPVKEVRKALYLMGLEQGYLQGHDGWSESAWNGKQPNPGELFLFQFIKQAARYCPRVELLTDVYSEDRREGMIKFLSWGGYPLYVFILQRIEKGYEAQLFLPI